MIVKSYRVGYRCCKEEKITDRETKSMVTLTRVDVGDGLEGRKGAAVRPKKAPQPKAMKQIK